MAATLLHTLVMRVVALGVMGVFRRFARGAYRIMVSACHRRASKKMVFALNNGPASNQLGPTACNF